MTYWGKQIDRALRMYDSMLHLQETHFGRYDVCRSSKFGEHLPIFIFSLTDDWKPSGKPVDYGIDTVLNRIKAHDLWRDDSFVENYIKNHEKVQESKDRARRNSIESFLYDFRSEFNKATKDINTANLNKLYRKEDSHGYHQSGS